MAKGDNPCIPLYDDADVFTADATAAITGGRFVKASGGFRSSPILNAASPATDGSNIKVAQLAAATRALGVAAYDAAAATDKIPVYSITSGKIVPMTAGADITAGVEVESDSAGKPVTLASGVVNGMAVSTATSGNIVYILLY